MSAGRLQLFDKRAGPRDRTSRLLVRIDGGRELRLREFGTTPGGLGQADATDELEREESIATLGPEAWPAPPADLRPLLDEPRPLHALLRDQRVIAGIGRSWVDEILWSGRALAVQARGRPRRRRGGAPAGGDRRRPRRGRSTTTSSGRRLPIPDKLPMPLRRPPPPRRAVPPLRRAAGGRPLRGLRDDLLPGLPDRRPDAQGPAAVAAAQVNRARPGSSLRLPPSPSRCRPAFRRRSSPARR